MRLLLIGGTGFIGSAIARALLADGHDLQIIARDIAYGRRLIPDARWLLGDLNAMTDAEQWDPHLQTVEAVINASGLLQSSGGDAVSAIQHDAIVAMAKAAARSGVERIVQISAAGAQGRSSEFMTTKLAADASLLAGSVPVLVLRPGLVIGRNAYGGTELIRMAAASPVAAMPMFGGSIRCIALDDVVDAVRIGLTRDDIPAHPIDLVGEDSHTLDAIILAHRQWMALPPPCFSANVPPIAMVVVTKIADFLGHLRWRSPLRSNAVAALEQGIDGDYAMTTAWLGRKPLSLAATLARMAPGKQDRIAAGVALLMPLALAALFGMWAASGVGTLADLHGAAALISKSGASNSVARLLAAGGAVIDLILAAALLWRPSARSALMGMVVVTLAYLLLGSWLLPELWLDPLAPLAKALPALVLALMLRPALEAR